MLRALTDINWGNLLCVGCELFTHTHWDINPSTSSPHFTKREAKLSSMNDTQTYKRVWAGWKPLLWSHHVYCSSLISSWTHAVLNQGLSWPKLWWYRALHTCTHTSHLPLFDQNRSPAFSYHYLNNEKLLGHFFGSVYVCWGFQHMQSHTHQM